MISNKLKDKLYKQGYRIIGKHSAIEICRWTKKSLINKGFCYKQKFYGIKSHLCCQFSPSLIFCQNKCLHCWREIEDTIGFSMKKIKVDDPKKIINGCILEQRKLLSGFKGNKKASVKKFKESLEPMQFAISLIGEPTLYPKLDELILELRKRKKTSFLVTNGLQPNVLKKLARKKALPTQLYLSLNTSNKKMYKKWHRSSVKNPWKKFNETLKLFPKLKTRKVIRMTLVKDMNMKDENIHEYVELIKKAKPDFIEVKGFISVGGARKRLGYEMMPYHSEIKIFAKKLAILLKNKGYKILGEHIPSKVVLIGKNKKKMKIQKSEI
jgi:tRNA wybutosine-synthesizing protein 1